MHLLGKMKLFIRNPANFMQNLHKSVSLIVSNKLQSTQAISSRHTENQQIKAKIINPFEHEDFFEVKKLVNVEKLFNSRVHYGHHNGLRNPWMNQYIFGTRMNIDIINLDLTCKLLHDALNIMAHIAFKNGIILFLTRDPAQIQRVEMLAKETGEYAHCRKWYSGTFTDSIHRYQSIVRLPDLCVFFNTNDTFNEEHKGVVESAKMLIPTIGIVDTNSDPNMITYPVPGNDDSTIAVELYCQLFKQTILKAKEKKRKIKEDGYEIVYD
jgi:small subunit ribosomal protein S2